MTQPFTKISPFSPTTLQSVLGKVRGMNPNSGGTAMWVETDPMMSLGNAKEAVIPRSTLESFGWGILEAEITEVGSEEVKNLKQLIA